ncbi:MAG TPA: zinc ABC transporter substrate-binding protein [Caldilineaceae bacterium]|nr:zinc ABC transporter substrate-binding protein [Caldilineaceae bacterium]
MPTRRFIYQNVLVLVALLLLVLSGCGAPTATDAAATDATGEAVAAGDAHEADHAHDELSDAAGQTAELPALRAVPLAAGEKLRVVATTSIIADVVAQVGGDLITLATLLPLGADPHAYTPTPQDLRTLNEAQVIFINGLGLEEALLPVLENLDNGAPVLSVNAGVEPLSLADEHAHEEETGEADAHGHTGADPHTWLDVANVQRWTETIRQALSALDPAHAGAYAAAAEAYQATLEALDQELRAMAESLPPEQRKLVTDHNEFAYFARAYGFTVIGTVIPSLSTLAEPSAQELAALQDQMRAEGVSAIFVGTGVSPSLARQLAQDAGVELVTLYAASLSAPDGPAPSYVELMRHVMQTILDALAGGSTYAGN